MSLITQIIRAIFHKPHKVIPDTYWLYGSSKQDYNNPFNKSFLVFKVLEVKNGYVLYQYCSENGKDHKQIESCSIRSFYSQNYQIPKPDWFN